MILVRGKKTTAGIIGYTAALLIALTSTFGLMPGESAIAQVTDLDQSTGTIGLPKPARIDPNAVIKAYYTFISAGQFNEAIDLLGPSFGLDPMRALSKEMRNLNDMIRKGEVAVSLDRIVKQGDWALAILIVDTKTPDGSKKKLIADQYLLFLNNVWTVIPKQLRQDPQFESFYDDNSILLYNWWKDNREKIKAEILDN